MHIGVFSFNTDYGISPIEFACEIENHGYESFWVPEHTHIPASRLTPYPTGGDLPRPYYHTADPFVSLASAAAVTERIKLGTSVCLLIQRDPITTAKEIATLDMLSGGRFIFGIGAGWNAEEMENHGTPFKRRFDVMEERVRAMKEIWANEIASFRGEFVNFSEIISYPKPLQTPHPPVIFGGATARARQRVVDFCDGWIPIDNLTANFEESLVDLRCRAELAGRDPSTLSISIFAFNGADGDTILKYRDLGVDRIVLISPRRRDDALFFLERFAEMVSRVN